MSRCVVYQSGGFTNYGISYRKYSQEELAEMENRAMTENEAKAVRFIENIKNHAMVTLDHIVKEEPNVSPLVYKGREERANTILAMVEELKQYREIGTLEECRAAMEKQQVFNMDKVVEQLKAEKEFSYADFDEYVNEVCPCLDAEYDDLFYKGLERAIDIVKVGGVDGN